jgi:glycosyltransferase involved in cell wall biosynthesis
MNPIRVAHILPFANVGGTELATLRLAESLAQSGFESILFCPEGADKLRHLYHDHCFITAPYEQCEPSYTHPLPYLRAAKHLAHELRRHKVAILHCSDVLAAHFAATAGRLAGAYVVSHVRCQHPDISRRDQTFLFPVQRFVFVSKDTWNVFGVQVPPSRGEVIYDGVPLNNATISREEARAAYSLPQGVPVIGMASRVHPGKDFETLIRAAKVVVDSGLDCRVLIAGDYQLNPVHREHYSKLKVLLEETGMSSRFVFAGFENNMQRFFATIDCFVLSTHAEGLPLVLLEAMAGGKPIVATSVGGIPEIVTHGESGLLVERQSVPQLAHALSTVLTNDATARTLSNGGRRNVLERFSEQKFHHKVRNLYCRIAKERGLVGNDPPCMST